MTYTCLYFFILTASARSVQYTHTVRDGSFSETQFTIGSVDDVILYVDMPETMNGM